MLKRTVKHQKNTVKTWLNDPEKIGVHYEIVATETWYLFGIPVYSQQTIVNSTLDV